MHHMPVNSLIRDMFRHYQYVPNFQNIVRLRDICVHIV